MKNIGRIILIVLGIVIAALCIKSFMGIPARVQTLEEAVYLNDPVVLPENEGKLVVIPRQGGNREARV